MTEQTDDSLIVLSDLDALSFDQFERNPEQDTVCVAPMQTMVHREEEILLVRRDRKVEEVDVSPACPVNSTTVTKVYQL